MVNTRKGSYVSQQSQDAPNVTSSPPPIQHARVRDRRFKSTPPRRPYQLPSEKLQGKTSSSMQESLRPKSVPEVGESSVPISPAEHAHRASEAIVSDLDSDDHDDVPLIRLLKKTSRPVISEKHPSNLLVSTHSQESSSREGVFIPTPGGLRRSPASYAFSNNATAHEKQIGVSRNEDQFASFAQDDIPSKDIPPPTISSHVLDIDHDVRPTRGPRIFDTTDWDESAEGFFADRELAARIVNSLTAESRALTSSIGG
ncbi:envelope-like protein [Cucumis melo var. makuwa]|uniref:Envelope-like protein n=1 Tax=Cucumis melo var. makuwa TaxID=1194695 RepID=A0A5A7V0W5_CUCMM|nr:envelope-like protein [Cucumis melo var. makuwa]